MYLCTLFEVKWFRRDKSVGVVCNYLISRTVLKYRWIEGMGFLIVYE